MNIARRIILIAMLAGFPALAADEEINVTPAIQAADAWLALIDGQRYGESWDQASQLFQDATPRLKWETTAQSTRGPLGAVQGRKMHSATYTRTLPGAPPGEYVVIRYETHFVNRPFSTETVTPSREKDGTWKVSGYFIL
ncbi:MAG: DUF4019 domain-containing protein [Usitatibacter sp.]